MESIKVQSKGDKNRIQAVGRRKEAVAKVRLTSGNGKIIVNAKPIAEYFKGIIYEKRYFNPFDLTKTSGQFDASIKVIGGGRNGQLDAVVHGISRALSKISLDFRQSLKKEGLLTRDPRAKERRKFGLAHKARAKKQSPKR